MIILFEIKPNAHAWSLLISETGHGPPNLCHISQDGGMACGGDRGRPSVHPSDQELMVQLPKCLPTTSGRTMTSPHSHSICRVRREEEEEERRRRRQLQPGRPRAGRETVLGHGKNPQEKICAHWRFTWSVSGGQCEEDSWVFCPLFSKTTTGSHIYILHSLRQMISVCTMS